MTRQPAPLRVSIKGLGELPAVSTMETPSATMASRKPLMGPSGLVSGSRERLTEKGLSVRRFICWMSA